MNRTVARIVCIFIAVIIVVGAIPAVALRAEDDFDLLYGREQLMKMEDGEKLVCAYDRIVDCVENRKENADIEDLHISVEQLDFVVEAYWKDPHPHFWSNTAYSYSYYSEDWAAAFYPVYNGLLGVSDSEFEKNVKTFNDASSALIQKAGINKYTSEYEKVVKIHDVLVSEITYVLSAPNAHNAYGAIVEKESVCQGYTFAFQYLLRLVGVQSHSVFGWSHGENHSWNIVRIDGNYYCTDVTWDDPKPISDKSPFDTYHLYLNVTEDTLKKDHIWVEPAYGLPECNSTDANYFIREGLKVSADTSFDKLAYLIKDGFAIYYATDDNFSAFSNYLSGNLQSIVSLAGYDLKKPVSIDIEFCDREIHVLIDGTLKEPDFVFGDIDKNGNVNSADSNLLKRVVAGSINQTEYILKAGDMDKNRKINSADSNLLKRKIAGF